MTTRDSHRAFTLTEVLVSISILVVIVLLISRLFNNASAITTAGHKRMDADGEIRPLLNRIAIDFAQMVRRADVDYFLKSSGNPQTGNDQIAFYSVVPGYNAVAPSPVSLVSYRISAKSQVERMAKGLIWNGDSGSGFPVVFLPLTINGTWPTATNGAADVDYEITGPNVFRFEYYYVLTNGAPSDTPWDAALGHTTPSGLRDVSAISVAIAGIDSKSRTLISDTQLATIGAGMPDFATAMGPRSLLTQWQSSLNAAVGTVPRPALNGIRLYERYFAITR
jgi:prepilin-type N-terminal cleavage/methylation domain-containing protein